MKRLLRPVLAALALALALGLCACGGGPQALLRSVGLDLKGVEAVEFSDSHGGFHGDGVAVCTVVLTPEQGEQAEEAMADGQGWHLLPLTDNLNTLLYGDGDSGWGFADGSWSQDQTPRPEEGWYFFRDRFHDTLDDSQVLNDAAFNFTAALYDSATRSLYLLDIDT